MTQIVTAPRTAAPASAPPGTADIHRRDLRAARRRRGNDALRRYLEGTPGRLRIAAAASMLACVVFALLGASAFQARGNALAEARADAAQLVRVQQIATSLVSADSLFTNGFLANGAESSSQLAGYNKEIATAARSIVQASGANPADAADLAEVGQALPLYTDRVARARANSAQGYQVATGYLRQAANVLRDKNTSPNMLPTLDKLITTNTTRVDDSYSASRWATLRLVLAALVVLVGLAAVQFWLARTTHRFLNVPLAGASVVVVLLLIGGAVVMATAQSGADTVRNGAYASTVALAKARIAAYSGNSQQSISLVYIGTGGASSGVQADYKKSIADAKSQLDTVNRLTGEDPGLKELSDWDSANQKVTGKAQTDWIAAAKAATKQGPGTVNDTFDALESTTRAALATQAGAVDDGLASRYGLLVITGWLTLVVGLVAAGAAWAGVSQRLEEYR